MFFHCGLVILGVNIILICSEVACKVACSQKFSVKPLPCRLAGYMFQSLGGNGDHCGHQIFSKGETWFFLEKCSIEILCVFYLRQRHVI